MNREDAGKIVTEYMKPVYGFALKRCAGLQDAEDFTQEICLKIYCALLKHEDIKDIGKFIWTIAHHALANYYRDNKRNSIGVSIDDMEDVFADSRDIVAGVLEQETMNKLHAEIAYLSKLQRRIVIENRTAKVF